MEPGWFELRRTDGANEHVVGECLPPVATGAAAASESVKTMRPHLYPTAVAMHAHKGSSQAQP